MAKFDPERMAVYRLARRHNRAVRALLNGADTRGFSDLVAQFRTSAVSMPANILEAAGEFRRGKRLHYLMIAKGSTCESWAHADALIDFGLATPADIAEVRDLQSQINALLTSTILALESRANSKSKSQSNSK